MTDGSFSFTTIYNTYIKKKGFRNAKRAREPARIYLLLSHRIHTHFTKEKNSDEPIYIFFKKNDVETISLVSIFGRQAILSS